MVHGTLEMSFERDLSTCVMLKVCAWYYLTISLGGLSTSDNVLYELFIALHQFISLFQKAKTPFQNTTF